MSLSKWITKPIGTLKEVGMTKATKKKDKENVHQEEIGDAVTLSKETQ